MNNYTCNSRMRGKLPVIEYGLTCPTTSSVALHNTWKPRESRLQATPDIGSSKLIAILWNEERRNGKNPRK